MGRRLGGASYSRDHIRTLHTSCVTAPRGPAQGDPGAAVTRCCAGFWYDPYSTSCAPYYFCDHVPHIIRPSSFLYPPPRKILWLLYATDFAQSHPRTDALSNRFILNRVHEWYLMHTLLCECNYSLFMLVWSASQDLSILDVFLLIQIFVVGITDTWLARHARFWVRKLQVEISNFFKFWQSLLGRPKFWWS